MNSGWQLPVRFWRLICKQKFKNQQQGKEDEEKKDMGKTQKPKEEVDDEEYSCEDSVFLFLENKR